ncbi:NTP transferase domain-containing protein, partial [Streptomyces sp. NPDC004976]
MSQYQPPGDRPGGPSGGPDGSSSADPTGGRSGGPTGGRSTDPTGGPSIDPAGDPPGEPSRDPSGGPGAGYDAVVLAGGAARRLGGADKPGVRVGGRALLDRVLAAGPSGPVAVR